MGSDTDRRFGGLSRLYGAAGAQRIRQAHVAVVGVGGVGSWAVECLARRGVGQLAGSVRPHVPALLRPEKVQNLGIRLIRTFVGDRITCDPPGGSVIDNQSVSVTSDAPRQLVLRDQMIRGYRVTEFLDVGIQRATLRPSVSVLHLGLLACNAPTVFGLMRHEMRDRHRFGLQVPTPIVEEL